MREGTERGVGGNEMVYSNLFPIKGCTDKKKMMYCKGVWRGCITRVY